MTDRALRDELERRREALCAELEAVRQELAAENDGPNAAELAKVESLLATLRARLKDLEQQVRWRELRNERARPRQP